jgi:hypothetical protein
MSGSHVEFIARFVLLSDNWEFVDMGSPLWWEGGPVVLIAAGPRQRSHSRSESPRDSRPYSAVSNWWLPQPGGPGPRIYIPENRQAQLCHQALGCFIRAETEFLLRPTVSRLVCLGAWHPSGAHDWVCITVGQLLVSWCGRPLWQEDGSMVYSCCWASPAQSLLSPNPARIMILFTVSNLRHLQSGRTSSSIFASGTR